MTTQSSCRPRNSYSADAILSETVCRSLHVEHSSYSLTKTFCKWSAIKLTEIGAIELQKASRSKLEAGSCFRMFVSAIVAVTSGCKFLITFLMLSFSLLCKAFH